MKDFFFSFLMISKRSIQEIIQKLLNVRIVDLECESEEMVEVEVIS